MSVTGSAFGARMRCVRTELMNWMQARYMKSFENSSTISLSWIDLGRKCL